MGIKTKVISRSEHKASAWDFLDTPVPPYANGGSHVKITGELIGLVDALIGNHLEVARLRSELEGPDYWRLDNVDPNEAL